MFRTYVIRSEHGNKSRWRRSLLHVDTATGFLPFNQAHYAHYFESEFAGSLNGLDGRTSGSTDIIHNHHARCFFAETFDPLTGAVLLLGFANQKSIQLTADHRYGNHNGIGTHGQATDGLRIPVARTNLIPENRANQPRSLRVESCSAAIDVIVAGSAGREFEFSQPE